LYLEVPLNSLSVFLPKNSQYGSRLSKKLFQATPWHVLKTKLPAFPAKLCDNHLHGYADLCSTQKHVQTLYPVPSQLPKPTADLVL